MLTCDISPIHFLDQKWIKNCLQLIILQLKISRIHVCLIHSSCFFFSHGWSAKKQYSFALLTIKNHGSEYSLKNHHLTKISQEKIQGLTKIDYNTESC